MQNRTKHILGWILFCLFLFVIFNLVTDVTTAFLRTAVIISTQIVVFYVNLKWILPKFYESKNYVVYVICNLFLLSSGVFLNNYVTRLTPFHKQLVLEENEPIEGTEYTDENLYIDNLSEPFEIFDLEIMFTHTMPIILIIFISFFLYTFQKRKKQEEKELAIITAEKNFLVQQINPHFLFNTLNNIYFLTYKTAPKGSEAIMQLSKMLDYSLYGEKEGGVTLEDEITYLNNFIALFKLKDSGITNISFRYELANPVMKIAPMLLLPFVENAFKHGAIEDTKNGFIKIELSTKANEIRFSCSNSYKAKKTVDKTGGIGIANVTRRLELLYPCKHQLSIVQKENEYLVDLKFETNV